MNNFFIKVYGCQMNVYDSWRIRDLLLKNGFEESNDIDNANIIIFYTCNIREKAVSKLLSDIGRINNPGEKIIAVGGCIAQAEGNSLYRNGRNSIRVIFGPGVYHNLPSYLMEVMDGKYESIIDTEQNVQKFRYLPARRRARFSDFVSIQEGCDNFCTYCVVPYTRGREYSRPASDIVDEIESLVGSGSIEITLLGQNVNSYRDGDWNLEKLLRKVANISGLKRLRYTTSHPRDFTIELMKIHEELNEIIPPFVHIPVQSGSDRILKTMNRGYTAQQYIDKIDMFRKVCPTISFSSDFIVGFPGETEKDFNDTVLLAQQVDYSQFFSFKYSRRKNTPAYSMDSQVPACVKDERLKTLNEILMASQLKFNRSCIGKVQKVIFEKSGKKSGQYVGKSEYMQSVIIESDVDVVGKLKEVVIKDGFQKSMFCEVVR